MAKLLGITVLVVDDSYINRLMIINFLANLKLNIIEAGSGQEALEILEIYKPELILLDLMMPEMDGFELLEIFKTKGIKIPVIVLTGRPKESSYKKCIELGAVGFLNKPFKMNDLLNEINNVLEAT
jgi:twitching motility two-component system response regulator PilH